MNKFENLAGARFARLTVIGKDETASGGKTRWVCRCDCGKMQTVRGADLRSGKTKSCGCLRKEVAPLNAKRKHMQTGTRLYNIWRGMKSRIYYSGNKEYGNYGGRGIAVCNEWHNSFEAFRDWALANGYADDLTIDRINTNGDYEPSNCRWSTYKEQENNRRNNRHLNICGCVKTLSEWAEISGIGPATLTNRIESGWPLEHLFIQPNLNNRNIRRCVGE